MLLSLLAILTKVDAGGQILPDEEKMTHMFTQNLSVHEVTNYEASARAEDSANVINMAASPPQFLLNITHTKVRVEPEIANTIIDEVVHGTNVYANSADVTEIAAPLSYQHDISSEATHLSDRMNHVETQRQIIRVPVDVNYQVSNQPANIKLQARPNMYVVSQPINMNYMENSAHAEVKLDKKSVIDRSVRMVEDEKSQSIKKILHKKSAKRPTQKPMHKGTTKRSGQKFAHKRTNKRPAQKPAHKKTKRPAQKPVHKRVVKKSKTVFHAANIKLDKSKNLKVKFKSKSRVKIHNRHRGRGHVKHSRGPAKNSAKGKVPLNIRIEEHTKIDILDGSKSHTHSVSQPINIGNPVRPVNVNVNIDIKPRSRPHMHPHREPMGPYIPHAIHNGMRHTAYRHIHLHRLNERPMYSRMRHIALRKYTSRRKSTRYTNRRRITLRPTTRKPTTAGLKYDVWLRFGGCDYMVKRDAKDFGNAEASCRKHGAHLVSIHSEAENNFIHKITSSGSSVTSFTQFVYIGLRKNANNEWRWIDGSPMNYNKWAAHQPDWPKEETCGQFHQDPAKLYDVQDYHWNSIRCIRPMKYYVCKKCKGSHHHQNNMAYHHHHHRCHCCCSCHVHCGDPCCKNKCNKAHKHKRKPAPATLTRPTKPPHQVAVFPGQAE
ncbi:unnamed protein product [Cylicocyclus nassatus]|uniref:C-type lectin domain-containing protein n=1 Tax=Cylicocyclus nassatus TaxID=53992 RepID=A0AA36H005_CYLNA|nr:unnamed protein product [Cylicocyclus nassatus]